MNGAFEVAAIALQAQQRALDVTANNVANVNTNAFRRSEVRFSEIIAQQADPATPRADLNHAPGLAGVSASVLLNLDEQGEIERTGRALDVAIDGSGFIELMGPAGQVMLWRGGTLSINDDGVLTGAEGLPLRAYISVPADSVEINISADGIVSARAADASDPAEIGRISLVLIGDPSAVERLDGGLYRVVDDASLTELTPGDDGAGTITQGALERSNVDLNDEMVRLLIIQRAYAANAQVVQAADQVMSIANGLRR